MTMTLTQLLNQIPENIPVLVRWEKTGKEYAIYNLGTHHFITDPENSDQTEGASWRNDETVNSQIHVTLLDYFDTSNIDCLCETCERINAT